MNRSCVTPGNDVNTVARTRRQTTGSASERASALVLIPVLVLVIVLAAGLVIDSAVAFSAKRALFEAAAAAANDAANALQDDPLYAGSSLALDAAQVQHLATAAVNARVDGVDEVRVKSATVTMVRGRPVVRITITGQARPVFGVLPGVSTFELVATASSTAWETR